MLCAAVLMMSDELRVLVRSVDAVARIKKWFTVFYYCLSVRGWGRNITNNMCACFLVVPSSQLAVILPASTTHFVLFSS